MREFVSPPQNHVWEMNQKIQKIEQNLNILNVYQNIPLKLRKVKDHKYELYVDVNKDEILQLKYNPNSSIMGIPIDLSHPSSLDDYPGAYFSKYTTGIDIGIDCILFQEIWIDYGNDPTGELRTTITVSYRKDISFDINISDYNYTLSEDDLFNTSSFLKSSISKVILEYFNIEDEQASIINLSAYDETTEGTYIIKTGSTLHTLSGLDKFKFPEGKAPTFETNKTYILKVTYFNNTYYCTDIKSYNNK